MAIIELFNKERGYYEEFDDEPTIASHTYERVEWMHPYYGRKVWVYLRDPVIWTNDDERRAGSKVPDGMDCTAVKGQPVMKDGTPYQHPGALPKENLIRPGILWVELALKPDRIPHRLAVLERNMVTWMPEWERYVFGVHKYIELVPITQEARARGG